MKLRIEKEKSSAPRKMEVGKMEIKKEIENEAENEVKMDQDPPKPLQTDTALGGNNDIKKKDDTFVKIIPKGPGIAYLTVNEMVVNDDESITMTAEEVRSYIEKGVFDQIVNNNPLAAMNKEAMDVHAKIREKRDDFQKLARLIDMIERDQLKFLRTDKNLRKHLTKTGGVEVELPALPNSLHSESLLKRETIGNKPAPAKPVPSTVASGLATKSATVFATKSAPVFATKSAPALATKSVPATGASAESTAKKSGADVECIDLTDDSEMPTETVKKDPSSYSYLGLVKHPAPLPPKPFSAANKDLPPIPPKPRLKISSEDRGIVLQWDMIPNTGSMAYDQLHSFDIFGYQEQKNIPINTLLWKKIGSVKAMTLPMACTLTQFIEGNKYHFSIRAVDVHNRCGFYSDPISIVYNQVKK